jgi:hypothetical protein
MIKHVFQESSLYIRKIQGLTVLECSRDGYGAEYTALSGIRGRQGLQGNLEMKEAQLLVEG